MWFWWTWNALGSRAAAGTWDVLGFESAKVSRRRREGFEVILVIAQKRNRSWLFWMMFRCWNAMVLWLWMLWHYGSYLESFIHIFRIWFCLLIYNMNIRSYNRKFKAIWCLDWFRQQQKMRLNSNIVLLSNWTLPQQNPNI